MQFLRFGVLSLLQGRKIDLSLIAAVIGVILAWANAVVFQIFVGEFEADSPNWREDSAAEGSVYVFDGRVAFFWAIAVIALLLLFLYVEAVALPLLVFASWVTILDSLILSITGGQDPFPAFAGLEEGGPASLLPLNVLTSLVIIAGVVLAVWPNRDLLGEKIQSLTGGEKLAIVLLLANALSYQLFFNQMNTDVPLWRAAYGVEETLFTAEGRLILAWLLAVLGLLTFFGTRGLLKWLLVIHWLWAVFLNSIIQGSLGEEDVWDFFGQSAPYNAIQQLQGIIGVLVALTAIWLFTGWYRNGVIAWMDKKGAEIVKDSEDFDHTSPLAIIAVLLAFLFPIGGLVLAAIAKREIALAKSNVGGVNLVVAANITAVVILSLQAFVLLTIGFDLIELAFLLEDLFPSE